MQFEDHPLVPPRRWISSVYSRASDLGKTWRTSLAPATLIVFLAGYVAGCNDWVHFGWLLVMTMPAAMALQESAIVVQMSRSGFMVATGAFIFWMTARSLWACHLEMEGWWRSDEVVRGMLGVVLFPLFALLVWITARQRWLLELSALAIAILGAVAALVSMLSFWVLLPGHSAGERLSNIFVYGGLNQVCTGLTFGFFALWSATVRSRLPGAFRAIGSGATLILLIATLFTLSRGALLALGAGYLAMAILRGPRRAWPEVRLAVAAWLVFLVSAPLLRQAAHVQRELRHCKDEIGAWVVTPQPVQELVARWDNGRFAIYRSALRTLDAWPEQLAGIGQWGTTGRWRVGAPWDGDHLHSGFLATHVHGGLIGTALFATVLALGVRDAWRTRQRQGQDAWLILLAFGIAGVTFDGQTLATLTSLPKFEGLLVWFPLIAAASLAARVRCSPQPNQPS